MGFAGTAVGAGGEALAVATARAGRGAAVEAVTSSVARPAISA
jgi:hypothetical protein